MYKIITTLIILLPISCQLKQDKKEANNSRLRQHDSLKNSASTQVNSAIKDTIEINNLKSALERSEQRFQFGNGIDFALDTITDESQQVVNYIEKYKEQAFDLKVSSNFFNLIVSKDKKFCLISWDSQQGGTNVNYISVAIAKSYHKTVVKSLTSENSDFVQMYYHTMEILSLNNGENIYLAQGRGRGSSADKWQDVRLFKIENDDIIFPNLFPKGKNQIFTAFDSHHFPNGDMPEIDIEKGGKKIVIPLPNRVNGFDNKYQRLILNSDRFKEQ
jgi:hypothetical protein